MNDDHMFPDDPLARIEWWCNQYWNARGESEAEYHAVLQRIHENSIEARGQLDNLRAENERLKDALNIAYPVLERLQTLCRHAGLEAGQSAATDAIQRVLTAMNKETT